MRTAWSYAWATLWMLRAIEASQVKAGQVQVDFENKVVKLYIAKSKTDQKVQVCGAHWDAANNSAALASAPWP